MSNVENENSILSIQYSSKGYRIDKLIEKFQILKFERDETFVYCVFVAP